MGTESDKLDAILQKMLDLESLFVRRLLDDKAKNKLIDQCVTESQRRLELQDGRAFTRLFKECFIALDRLQNEQATPELCDSVVEEFLGIFEVFGVELIQVKIGDPLNPNLQEVVDTVNTEDETLWGTVAKVIRSGYSMRENILRHARVIAYVAPE